MTFVCHSVPEILFQCIHWRSKDLPTVAPISPDTVTDLPRFPAADEAEHSWDELLQVELGQVREGAHHGRPHPLLYQVHRAEPYHPGSKSEIQRQNQVNHETHEIHEKRQSSLFFVYFVCFVVYLILSLLSALTHTAGLPIVPPSNGSLFTVRCHASRSGTRLVLVGHHSGTIR
jgi:hypothetical protein